MEFKFRAIDNIKPSPTSRSLSTVAYLPDRSLQLPLSVDGDISGFRVPLVGEAFRRELEKEQIRREIIAGEIARRRELEEEVRRELALERALGIPMQRPLSFQERLSPWSNHVASVDDRIGASTQQPFIMPLPPQISDNKDKVIVLAKPDPGLYSAKRKAMAPVVDDPKPSAFGLKKKSKEEWSCALCQIKATSESGLNAHLNGKKHKAKEAGHNIRKNDKSNKAFLSRTKREKTVKATETIVTTKSELDAKTDQQPLQPCIALGMMNETMVDKGLTEAKKEEQLMETVVDKGVAESINVEKLAETMIDKGVTESKNEEQLVEINQNTGTLKNKKDTATVEARKINAVTRTGKVERLWCDICRVGTFSQVVLEDHKKGKKHISKMKKFSQNNVSFPSTSCSEAPKLIKDTDGVNKATDQRITPVVKIETIFR